MGPEQVETAHAAVDRAARELLAAASGSAPMPPPVERQPPSTYRLNDEAVDVLWPAYLAAKRADHFLSLRQYLSQVVLHALR